MTENTFSSAPPPKSSPLTTVLLALVVASALASVVLCYMYNSNTRELRSLQGQAALVNNNRTVINALAADAIEYAKKNPSMEPVLEAVGLKQKVGAAPATNKPAAK
jgi:hypothetical protein